MPLTFDRIKLHMVPYEGNVEHMYLCTAGKVTVGIGNMLPNAATAQALNFVDRTTRNKASAEAIKTDFDTVAKQTKGLPHRKYLKHTKLEMPDVDINALFKSRINQFEKSLRKLYTRYDAFPDDAQLALLDMIFNLGAGGLGRFKKLNKAVNDEDWATAAESCNRMSCTDARNSGTKELFLASATAKEALAKAASTR
jgi:GH24 family phage-related lysozyme (muramidase)